MSTEQIKNLICSNGYFRINQEKMRNIAFFLVQTFLDANTDFDFRMKSKYKVQGFLQKQSKSLALCQFKNNGKILCYRCF